MELSNREFYRYNDQNKKISREVYMDNALFIKERNKYDSEGELIENTLISKAIDEIRDEADIMKYNEEKISYDTSRISYNYDHFGNMIKSVTSDAKGNVLHTTFLEYDNGEIEKIFSLAPSGDTISTGRRVKEGNIRKEIVEDYSKKSISTTWWVNRRIQKSITYYKNGKGNHRSEYKYNSKGDRIESLEYK